MKRLRFCLLLVMVLLTGGLFWGCADSPYPDPERPASVTLAALGGVIAPTNAAIPVTAITPTAQYTGTIAWSPADADFQPSTVYTATITLSALEGFSFFGVADNFFTVPGATAVSYTNTANGTAVVKAVFPQTEQVDMVTLTNIPGVTSPATGGVPVTIIDAAQYTGAIVWSPADSVFHPDTIYSATITLSPKTGYVFTGLPANAFRVNGIVGTSAADSGVVGVTFPQTGPPVVVDIKAIPGVPTPVAGGKPVTNITETAQYTGTVTWSPADATFQVSTVYTATITLTPKLGYTLTGVSADFFTVLGADTVNNPANSGVVTASFPETAAVTYASDLFISEYIEGGSNNKYIEIFNGTGSTVNLSGYWLVLFSNGATTASNPVELSTFQATLDHNSVLVVANAGATLGYLDHTSTVTYFNGDDALALTNANTGQYVDIFGRIGERPSPAWISGVHTTLDRTLVRKAAVKSGITVNPGSGFPTLETEWDVYPINTASYLGSHTFSP